MAELKNVNADIELSNPYNKPPEDNRVMPRMDMCHNCGRSKATHVELHCLMESTTYKPLELDFEMFRSKFMAWAAGQKIEEALCRIVYELTRGDK